MAPTVPTLPALRAFVMVGRTGSIRKAARDLGLSHAIVSRHVSGIEALLGVLLLDRRTGGLTRIGEAYHARVSAALDEIEAATREVVGSRRTALTIWCSPGFSLHWLAHRLPEFARRQGAGRGQRLIDLKSADYGPDFESDEADGDIRYWYDGQVQDSSLATRSEVLARPEVFPVATREFLDRLRRPLRTVADIAGLPLIQEAAEPEWPNWFAAQGFARADVPSPVARYGQAHLALVAARAGQGIALANRFLAGDDLASGSLVRVEPRDDPLREVTLGAYCFRCSRARWSDPVLARFRQWLHEAIAETVSRP